MSNLKSDRHMHMGINTTPFRRTVGAIVVTNLPISNVGMLFARHAFWS